jgi:outer membrane protein OmpA-like peptidoglycan-associated protein
VGHPALTADGQTLYFVSDMPGGYGGTDIYVTKQEDGKWGVPQNLGPEINTEGMEMFPYVDKEKTLYFASNGQDGLDGLDNFKKKWNADTKKWGRLRNIGAPINGPYDDFGLVYGKDKSLGYFTSNRPGGKGSDDIYSFEDHGVDLEGIVVDAKTGKPICKSSVKMNNKATNKEEGPKQTECDGLFEFTVVNNTDYCFEAMAEGYLPNNTVCATTKGVKPGETVFVRIPLQKDEPTALTVLVLDKATKLPIAGSKVALSNSCTEKVENGESDDKGTSCYMVKCGCGYIATANASGYLPGSGEGSTRDNCPQVKCGEGGGDTIIVELEKIEVKAVELKDIYYDFDKWNIRPESEPQLNILLGFLKENPDAIVEIASHTDARAPYDYNIRLSQKRAQSVVDWLVAHGIERSRLKPKGYGETKLRNSCKDDVKCSEYEHQRNRRTEFQVIGGDIDIKSLERFDMQVDPCKVCPF